MGQWIEGLTEFIRIINLTQFTRVVECNRTIVGLAVSEAFLQGFDRRGCLRN